MTAISTLGWAALTRMRAGRSLRRWALAGLASVMSVLVGLVALPLLVFTPPASAHRPVGAVGDIPAPLLVVYADAAARCEGLRWPLLAGVAKVESDHGRFGGAVLDDDLNVTPPIVGIALDGGPGVAAIPVPAGGSPWHGDPVWDHAVGPFQFITGTWTAHGVDGNDDGVASPHNYRDAAYAAADYLCRSAGGAIEGEADERRALWAYNRSEAYAEEVLGWADRYSLPAGANARLLLDHPNVSLSAVARADLEAGTVDWRLIALVAELAQSWQLHLGNFSTGHSRCAVLPGGTNTGPDCSVSNHYYGRATDITVVAPAGGPAIGVSAHNPHARALLEHLRDRPADLLTPEEVGQPWGDLAGLAGWFTNELHQAHLHIAFESSAPPPPAPPGGDDPDTADSNAPRGPPTGPIITTTTTTTTGEGAGEAGPSAGEVGGRGGANAERVITRDNTVLDGVTATGGLVVRASNVTIRNSHISGNTRLVVNCDGCQNLVIEDTTIEGTGPNADNCIGRSNYTLRRVRLTGCIDGAKANGNVVITDSWIGNLRRVGDSHNDGIQSTGGHRVIIRDTTIVHDTGGQTSAVKLTSENRDLTGVEVVGNRLISSTCRAVYFTAKNGHSPPTGTITNNTISGHTCPDWLQLTAGPGQHIDANRVP